MTFTGITWLHENARNGKDLALQRGPKGEGEGTIKPT
jgi:hypothetical protein